MPSSLLCEVVTCVLTKSSLSLSPRSPAQKGGNSNSNHKPPICKPCAGNSWHCPGESGTFASVAGMLTLIRVIEMVLGSHRFTGFITPVSSGSCEPILYTEKITRHLAGIMRCLSSGQYGCGPGTISYEQYGDGSIPQSFSTKSRRIGWRST